MKKWGCFEMDKQMSHTEHMANLLMEGIIWQSMHFEEIAHIMTLYGLETTESEAMDAYDHCMFLGYPRGGTPNAFSLVDRNGELTYTIEKPNELEIYRNGISSKWWRHWIFFEQLPFSSKFLRTLDWMFLKEDI